MKKNAIFVVLFAVLTASVAFAGQVKSINAYFKNKIFTMQIFISGDCLVKKAGENKFVLENCKLDKPYSLGQQGEIIDNLLIKPSDGNTIVQIFPAGKLNYSYEKKNNYILFEVFPENLLKPEFNLVKINKNEIIDITFPGSFDLIPKKQGNKVILEAKGAEISSKKMHMKSDFVKEISTYQTSGSACIEIALKDKYPVEVTGSNGNYKIKIMPVPTYGYKSAVSDKVSLEFINADVRSVVRAIADALELNVVFDPEVTGKVSISLKKPVYWEDALNAVLDPLGFTYVKTDNYLRITSKKKLVEEARLEPVYTYVIPLNYATAEEVAKIIKPMIERAKARTAEKERVQVDTRTNSLLLKVTKERYNKIMNIINKIDKRTKQVVVRAKIIQLNSNMSKELGISWGISAYNRLGGVLNSPYVAGSGGFYSSSTGSFPLIGVVDPSAVDNVHNIPIGSQTLALGFLNRSQTLKAELAIKALETDGTAKIISNPQVVTLDNEEATIEQGLEIPYTESTVAAGGATSYTVDFKKASLILKVKPHVTNDGNILLEVEVRKDTPNYEHVQLTGSNEPAINTRNVKSKVMIKNGDTIVIGGIYEKEKDINKSGIPGLSRLPLLGWLFKQNTTTIKKTELLVFITPEIMK